jgi:hypothetical protein
MSWLEFPQSRRRMLIGGAGVLAGAAAAAALNPFTAAGAQQSTYANPVIWQDLADVEIIRVGSDFYMTASTMHYSPGAPVLHSRRPAERPMWLRCREANRGRPRRRPHG